MARCEGLRDGAEVARSGGARRSSTAGASADPADEHRLPRRGRTGMGNAALEVGRLSVLVAGVVVRVMADASVSACDPREEEDLLPCCRLTS